MVMLTCAHENSFHHLQGHKSPNREYRGFMVGLFLMHFLGVKVTLKTEFIASHSSEVSAVSQIRKVLRRLLSASVEAKMS